MNIVIFSQNLEQDYISGGRWYPYYLAHALADKGHKVLFVADHIPSFLYLFDKFPNKKNFTHEVIPDLSVGNNLNRYKNFDIFIGSPTRGADIAVALAQALRKKSIVICYETHNWVIESAKRNYNTIDSAEGFWRDYVKQSKLCDMFMIGANLAADYARKWIPEIKNKIVVLPNAINSLVAEKTKYIPIEDREHAVVFLSRADKHKGYQDIWQVLGYLTCESPHVYFITGYLPEDLRKHIQVECNRRKLKITFKQNCSDVEKFDILSKVKALFFPTRFEGFGLPPAESFYVSTPVIAYGLKILREVYGGYPHYLSQGDLAGARKKVSELLTDDERLFAKIEEAKMHVETFAKFENYSDRLENIIQTLTVGKQVTESVVGMSRPIPKWKIEKKMSIVVPVFNVSNKYLNECVQSLLFQSHQDIEIVIVNDGTNEENLTYLRKYRSNKKFKFVDHKKNKGLPVSMTGGIKAATGDYICLVDDDDILDLTAVEKVLCVHEQGGKFDVVYTNEMQIDEHGRKIVETKKPDWSVDFLLQCQYLNHLTSYRAKFLKDLMPCKKKYKGSWDYDLVLRAAEKSNKFAHLPITLYKWRIHSGQAGSAGTKKYVAQGNGIQAVRNYVKRNKLTKKLSVKELPHFGYFQHEHHIEGEEPSVLVAILTRDLELTYQCLTSLELNTQYKNYEVLIGHCNPDETWDSSIDEYGKQRGYKVQRIDGPFNFSKAYNRIFDKHGKDYDYMIVLNDDVVLGPRWLTEMIAMFDYRKEFGNVGVVGAKLLFPNTEELHSVRFPSHWRDASAKIQHAGVPLLTDKRAAHIYINSANNFLPANYVREWPSVTFALAAISNKCFKEVRMNENYIADLTDIEFCVRATQKGYRIFYNPFAVAFHIASETRKKHGMASLQRDHNRFQQEYADVLKAHKLSYRDIIQMQKEGV